ncbi:MAG: GNAT family N-acetyltransferase [Anaerolineae bacterium]|nr:GNAT family N-acetyltransferase [Anaerolineae bacterium]MCI0609674.1 GNAT family N-acetyltransferase [Anaerolineae bacterium]
MKDILTGNLVRLAAFDPEEVGKAFSGWSRDSEYWRLMDSGAIRLQSTKEAVKNFEKEVEELAPGVYFFGVRRLADDVLIGEMVLDVVNWSGRDAFVGLSIGARENWGKGYGTDMMKVLLRFAFTEVNLKRVSLGVFEYNPRAIRSYEKSGFCHEGRQRGFLNREGKRWDMPFMGILREEWMNLQEKERENM